MVLGDGSGISEEDMGNFRELGVSHILVVSGMHMTVLAAFLQLALKRLPIRKAVGNLLTGLCLAAVFGPLRIPALGQPRGRPCTGCCFWRIPPAAAPTGSTPWGWRCWPCAWATPLPGGELGLRPVGDGHAGHCAALPPLGAGFPGRRRQGLAFALWKPAAVSRRQRRPPCWGPSRCSWRCLGDSPCCCLWPTSSWRPPARPCCTWLSPVPF